MSMVMTDNLRFAGDTDQSDGAERRRGLRVPSNRPVKVLNHLGGKYFGGETKDVSSTGLRLELPAHAMVRCGEQLSIHVGLSADGSMLANRRQMISTRVVWVNRATSFGKSVMVGLEFASSITARSDAA